MIENVLNPPALQDYAEYFKAVLSVSGVLLGVAFAGLIFFLQSGLSSFTFSRPMFLKLYALFGRHLLIVLAYLTLMPIGMLFLGSHIGFLSLAYAWFCLVFTKSYLDFHQHRGYIYILNSTAFVPAHYGRLRTYFRYLTNMGLLTVLVLGAYVAAFTLYPVVVSHQETGSFLLSTKGIFYSTLILLGYSVIRIVGFIPEFYTLSLMEAQLQKQSEDSPVAPVAQDVDFIKEKAVLRQHLLDHGAKQLGMTQDVPLLDGTVSVNLQEEDERAEAWLIIAVRIRNSTPIAIQDAVCDHAYALLRLLDSSLVALNSFVLSYNIYANGEATPRFMFFRTDRAELQRVLATKGALHLAVRKIKNKVFDELFRDLD